VEGRPLLDAELIELAKQGDVDAYEQLVLRYREVAVHTAYVIAGSEAEDCAQEAFVKAYYAIGRFREGAPFRPWLLRIVANEARNRARSLRRRGELTLNAGQDRSSGDAAPSPEAAVLAEEQKATLLAELNRLRPKHRLLIAYRYFMELSEAEMAEVLGVPKGTIKSRLSRALANLRELVDAAGGESNER
jgi:RNA polymerase sigma factor (sigma-70 family)